ncbi:MAG: hypothetical protein WC901_05660 [Candidatus Margulisiibacteriota bacterium]
MKKFVICLVALVFVTTLASVTFGRTIAEERQAVRDYLNEVDAKLATAKQANNKERVRLLHAEKSATLARWNKLRAEMEVVQAPVPVPPTVVIVQQPAPRPVPVVKKDTKAVGRGVALYVNGGLDAGLTGFSGNLDYDLSGLPAQGLKLRIGGNYISGTNPVAGDIVKAVSAKLGFLYYITPYMPDMSLPLSWYIGGAYLYPVMVNAGRTGQGGQYGLEAYLGTNFNIAEMGIVNFELGYSELKYSSAQTALKGIDLKIGYGIVF